MSSRIAAAVLLAAFGFQALSQTASPAVAPAPKVPDQIVYEAFFQKVMFLEDLAKKLDAQKEEGWRRCPFHHPAHHQADGPGGGYPEGAGG
jgi:hypothetical protein